MQPALFVQPSLPRGAAPETASQSILKLYLSGVLLRLQEVKLPGKTAYSTRAKAASLWFVVSRQLTYYADKTGDGYAEQSF